MAISGPICAHLESIVTNYIPICYCCRCKRKVKMKKGHQTTGRCYTPAAYCLLLPISKQRSGTVMSTESNNNGIWFASATTTTKPQQIFNPWSVGTWKTTHLTTTGIISPDMCEYGTFIAIITRLSTATMPLRLWPGAYTTVKVDQKHSLLCMYEKWQPIRLITEMIQRDRPGQYHVILSQT